MITFLGVLSKQDAAAMEWFSQVVIVNVDDFGASPPSPALSRVCGYAFHWEYRRSLENHKVDSHSQCNVAESEGRDLTFSTTLCLALLKNKSQLFECKYDLYFKAGVTCCPHVLAWGDLPKPVVHIPPNSGNCALYFGSYCFFFLILNFPT